MFKKRFQKEVPENIIIIIGDPSETHWRPIGDLSETDMPDRRRIGDLDILHWRLTCPIGERHV